MNINTLANFLGAYQNQSPFIILLRDLPAQVLKTLAELKTRILRALDVTGNLDRTIAFNDSDRML